MKVQKQSARPSKTQAPKVKADALNDDKQSRDEKFETLVHAKSSNRWVLSKRRSRVSSRATWAMAKITDILGSNEIKVIEDKKLKIDWIVEIQLLAERKR
jgi:hypothetical protein